MGRAARPGEWLLIISALSFMAAPLLVFVTVEDDARVADLRRRGVTAEARVIGKSEWSYLQDDRRGRPRSRTERSIRLSYDALSRTPHAEFEAGRRAAPHANLAIVSTDIPVGRDEYAGFSEGDRVMVTYLPGDSGRPELSDWVARRATGAQGPIQYLVAALLVILGIWTGLRWLRVRRSHG
ncbi:hypothetical protein [Sphingomonas sp. G-3-2-10]|uniref:hypothetical protein n=1 Tax=Sphingomonas sp. G-3-2-10 TaxID=2728838 RepID=UPI00146B0E3F|nr:hypothetical protein [Sphingomonas sp. G-3-2-10]NML04809.1 hypothetical protein [Sphingomonas sp. G-3-2-10]